jgi:competence protein ComEC
LIAAGSGRYAAERNRLPDWDQLPVREARLGLEIDRVFAGAAADRCSGLATVFEAEPHLRELVGQRMHFSLQLQPGESAPVRTARVAATGLLAVIPRAAAAGSFDQFLYAAGMNFRLNRGRILAEARPAYGYYRWCAAAADRCRAILSLGIDPAWPDLAALLRAMMLGETHELSEAQHEAFLRAGAMHLFAISGMNITVIASALTWLLLHLRLSPRVRFVLATVVVWVFVDITGGSPSAVRACLMSILLAAALTFHQPANPLAALAATAGIILLVAPLQLFSASFVMSYAIVFALMGLGAPLATAWQARVALWSHLPRASWPVWRQWVERAWLGLIGAIAAGTAATLVGVLTGVQYFHLLTPAAMAANLVLIPVAGFATLAGFAALLCGAIGAAVPASICNHAAILLLSLIDLVVRGTAALPGAAVPADYRASWIATAALAALLASIAWGYAQGWRTRAGGWWPPFAVVGLTLACGVAYSGSPTADTHRETPVEKRAPIRDRPTTRP